MVRSPTALFTLILFGGCATHDTEVDGSAITVQHVFDFATQGPSRLSIMFSMAWFGISTADPQTPVGPDPGYHNWAAGGTPCSIVTPNAAASDTCVLMGVGNVCLATGNNQRRISSRRRPLTGIWSGTGLDTESQRKIDLLLTALRRPGCRVDDGAKLDAWTMQNNSIRFSSKYVSNPSPAADYPYRMMMTLFDRADAAGIGNAIMPGFDSTWYFHFGGSVGLGKCDNSTGNPRSNCINVVTQDLRDMAVEATKRRSAVKVNGKPVLFVYTDHWQAIDQGHGGTQPSAAEWVVIFGNARSQAGTDFYVVGVSDGPDTFLAFDALAPWLGAGSYVDQAGTSIYTDSFNHTLGRHQALIDNVGKYPGRLVYGGITPGFDDWTRNWSGPCRERQMPPGAPRDPNLLTAQMDFFFKCKTGGGCTTASSKYDFRGFVGETWDDWTEGSEFEPDVHGGPAKLLQLRQLLGKVFGDAYPDATGDSRLANRWTSYGQARNGNGGAASIPPVTNLSCDGTGAINPIQISLPQNDSVQANRIHVVASDTSGQTADSIQVYLDGLLAGQDVGSSIDVDIPSSNVIAAGTHKVSIKTWFGGTAAPVTDDWVSVTTDPVALTFPVPSAVTAGSVHVLARDNTAKTATTMQIYLDGVMIHQLSNPPLEILDKQISISAPGSHRVGVKSWYSDGTSLLTEHLITVSTAPVVEVLPVNGSTVHGPVFVQGTDNSSKTASSMQVYLDSKMIAQMTGGQIEAHVYATTGSHQIAVKAWYTDGTSMLSAPATVNVQ